jgi:hypothetical protein
MVCHCKRLVLRHTFAMADAQPGTNVNLPDDGAGTEQAREQSFMGAYYYLVTELRQCLFTQQHDAQRLEAQEGPIRRLISAVIRVGKR